MTPILKGTASRLGLRKPLPPLEIEISVEMAAFNESLRGVREFMARNDEQVRAAFVDLSDRLKVVRSGPLPAQLRLRIDRPH